VARFAGFFRSVKSLARPAFQLATPPANELTREVEFPRTLSGGGSMKKSYFTDSQTIARAPGVA
jgi:hypothetical protein